MARRECVHCLSEHVKLRRQIIANGTNQVAWWCLDCERWAETPIHWLPHAWLEEQLRRQDATINDIPIIADHSKTQLCVICGQAGDSHHWAPQAYASKFGDEWAQWPQSHLCRKHHRQWHDILTPGLWWEK